MYPRARQSGLDVMLQEQFDLNRAVPVEVAGDGNALFDLGMLYSSGREGPIDLVAAHKWFNLAAIKGRADAAEYRREVAELMSRGQIATAQREARAWLVSH